MKKYFYSLMALTFASATVLAADEVKMNITMNTLATSFKVVPMAQQAEPEVTEVGTRQFEFMAVPGTDYKLVTYDKNSKNTGSIVLTASDSESANTYSIFTPSVKVTNSGWTIGSDCTVDLKVKSSDNETRNIESSMELGYITVPAVKGDSFAATVTPSDARADEGYVSISQNAAITFNRTFSMKVPVGYTYSLTVPSGAKAFVGSKTAHFVPFTEQLPSDVKDNGDGTTTYSYLLAEKGVYNYRVKYATAANDYVTVAEKFTMPAENTAKAFTVTDFAEYGSAKTVISLPASNKGYNVSDVWVNGDYRGCLDLKKGETKQIVNLRNWEITDNITNNYFIEPDYHYSVIGINGNASSDVISVDAVGKITALSAGTAIVLVTYDALYAPSQLGGPLFGAIEPENTGVIVVTVDAPASTIKPNTFINSAINTDNNYLANKLSGENLDAEIDVLYFTGDAASYTFAPENVTSVMIASPAIDSEKVTYTGFSNEGVKENSDGSYTLSLTAGRNIVMLTGNDGSTVYQVIRAKKCTPVVTNLTAEGAEPKPGDQVSVRIDGLYHPANKLAGVYNFNALVSYTDPEGNAVKSKANQYQFASNEGARTLTVTIPADWDAAKDYTLTDGMIFNNYFGDPLGSHRSISYEKGRDANFNASQRPVYLGAIPSLTIYKGMSDDDDVVILDFEDASFKGNISDIAYTTPGMTESNYWSSLIDSPQYGGPQLYPETAPTVLYGWYDQGNTNLRSSLNIGYGDGKFWNGGTAVSNYVATTYTKAGYERQLEAYSPDGGKGGYNGSDNFLVANGSDNTSYFGSDSRPVIEFNGADGEPLYVYVTLGTYGICSALDGDGYNPAATDTDWVDVTVEGLDAEGNAIDGASSRIRLIDGRSKITDKWTKWDLTALGKCRKMRFNVESSMVGTYGLNFPAYFLLDNFAVKAGSGSSGIENVAVDNTAGNTTDNAVYDLMGRRLHRIPGPGIYIIGGKKAIIK